MRKLLLIWVVLLGVILGCSGDDGPSTDCTRMVCGISDGGYTDTRLVRPDAESPGDDAGGGTDDGGSAGDSGTPTLDASVECNGVHPIVGPPRTCERGSCLCVETDACFTVDVADACCDGELVCAPPVDACMGAHPIVGPPRTCESGSCYCASPDACFPMATAAECCAVDVVCVP